jgi:hypothetical protein
MGATTLSITTVSIATLTTHSDIQCNDTQHIDTWYNDTRISNPWHSDIQYCQRSYLTLARHPCMVVLMSQITQHFC